METAIDNRPTVLAFSRFFRPAYKAGGPVQTITSMVDLLGNDINFRIFTSDRDLGDNQPFDGIRRNLWARVGNAEVMYASPRKRGFWSLVSLITSERADVLYINNLVHPVFGFRVILVAGLVRFPRERILVAPRGVFTPGALSIKKSKKDVYFRVLKALRVCNGYRWQASSATEASQIHDVMGVPDNNIIVAPNLTNRKPISLENEWRARSSREPIRIVFLSRISPMKNLLYAIEVLGRVRTSVSFSIFGPIEDEEYWKRCVREMDELPKHVRVNIKGALRPESVAMTLSRYDLFFLPTLGENFGHVIGEALSAGTSVLISDQTPWRELTEWGAGWSFPLSNRESFAHSIEACAAWDPTQQASARSRAIAYARMHFGTQNAKAANLRLMLLVATKERHGAEYYTANGE